MVKRRLGSPHLVTTPVVIVDVSVTGAAVQVPDDLAVTTRQMFGLGIGDEWSNVRCVWVRRAADGSQICGVIFVDPYPPFLPAIHAWLGRGTARSENLARPQPTALDLPR
jgi:hypothetical protein